MYEKILGRTFVKFELWKRLGVWAFLGFLLISFSFYAVLKPYRDPLPHLNLQLSRSINFKRLSILGTGNDLKATQQIAQVNQPKKFEPFLVPECNFSGQKSDFCEINGDIRIQGKSSSIFFTSPQLRKVPENSTWGIKIYARKTDRRVMGKVKEILLKPAPSDEEMPGCTVNHTIPAVVFSAGGYAGNFFHGMSDVIIPLYRTTLQFNGEVQLLSEGKQTWWMNKYDLLFKALSNYNIIDLNNDKEIQCFKNVIVGLKSHKDLVIDPELPPNGYSTCNFTQFLRRTYSLERETAIKLRSEDRRKPRLLIISRKKTRACLNEDEVAAEAQRLGYHVEIIDTAMNMKNISKMVNSFDVMIGVHGAGLTNMVFLPENAVVVQVVPLCTESISDIFFKRPSVNMNLKYLEYRISEKESTLAEQYPINHQVFTDPGWFKKQGWSQFRSVYLDSQNVRLDVTKFRTVLLEALQLLHESDILFTMFNPGYA